MEEEKLSYSLDVKLPKYRWPRKHKKRWKASIAKQLGVKPSQIKVKEVVWSFCQSVKEKIEYISKRVKPVFH